MFLPCFCVCCVELLTLIFSFQPTYTEVTTQASLKNYINPIIVEVGDPEPRRELEGVRDRKCDPQLICEAVSHVWSADSCSSYDVQCHGLSAPFVKSVGTGHYPVFHHDTCYVGNAYTGYFPVWHHDDCLLRSTDTGHYPVFSSVVPQVS